MERKIQILMCQYFQSWPGFDSLERVFSEYNGLNPRDSSLIGWGVPVIDIVLKLPR